MPHDQEPIDFTCYHDNNEILTILKRLGSTLDYNIGIPNQCHHVQETKISENGNIEERPTSSSRSDVSEIKLWKEEAVNRFNEARGMMKEFSIIDGEDVKMSLVRMDGKHIVQDEYNWDGLFSNFSERFQTNQRTLEGLQKNSISRLLSQQDRHHCAVCFSGCIAMK